MLGIEMLRGAVVATRLRASSCHQWSRPACHRDAGAGALVDDHVAHVRAILERFIDGRSSAALLCRGAIRHRP